MPLKVGIVGLANVGKSTLFNALAEQEVAEVGNYPFTTVEPNVATVQVPDKTLLKLKEFLGVPRTIPTTIKFVDIAGLIKGAHKGEGLGNQFLAHIRNMHALAIVLRAFENPSASFEPLSPKEQLEVIQEELRQKDRETLVKKAEELRKEAKADKEKEKFLTLVERMIRLIDEGESLKDAYQQADKEEKAFLRSLFLLSLKPYFLVLNVSEKDLDKSAGHFGLKEALLISAKTEKELIELSPSEQKEYLSALGLKEKALKRIIRRAYELLGLITFYTYKPNELVQAWSLKRGKTILEAARKIHSDFAEKFIKAEVINVKELFRFSSLTEAGKKGKIRIEGRDYLLQDKDLIYIHHG